MLGSSSYKFESKNSISSHFASKKAMGSNLTKELGKHARRKIFDDLQIAELDQSVTRCKPESLDSLLQSSKFSRNELKVMYRNFKQVCPYGFVTLKQFQQIFSQLFPHGVLQEIVQGLSALNRGTPEEQLKWVFSLYDQDRDGILRPIDVYRMITSMYQLLGPHCEPPVDVFVIRKRTWEMFSKWDTNRDGAVTQNQFIQACMKEGSISHSLAMVKHPFEYQRFFTSVPADRVILAKLIGGELSQSIVPPRLRFSFYHSVAALLEAEKGFFKVNCKNVNKALEVLKRVRSKGYLGVGKQRSKPGNKRGSVKKEEPVQKFPLFPEDENSVFLQLVLVKVPVKCGLNVIRIPLPRPFRNEQTTSVCLFTKDLSRRWNDDVEKDSREFKEYLTFQKGVRNLDQVISLSQLKREFQELEAKRRLCSAFDVFVVDERVSPHVHRNLGKTFLKARKLPTAIDIQKGNVSSRIKFALSVTCLTVQPHCTRCTVKFGELTQSTEELMENFEAVLKYVREKLPGGWNNVRYMYVECGKMESLMKIPVYVSLNSVNDVDLTPHEKKEAAPVEGELSTLDEEIFGSSRVKVYPDGRISIFDKDGKEIDDWELSDDAPEKSPLTNPNRKRKLRKISKNELNESLDEKFMKKEPKTEQDI